MFKGFKQLAAAVLLTSVIAPASASLVTLNDGVNPAITFDEMGITTQGDSVITQTFVDGVNDTFVELGLTAVTSFKTNGGVSGLPSLFDLLFDVNLQGTAATVDNGDGTYNIDVTFGSLSSAVLKHDSTPFGGLNGTVTDIANLSMGSGSCELVIDTNDIQADNEGKCNLSFAFDSLLTGWFTAQGTDFMDLDMMPSLDIALDIDVKSFAPGFPTTIITVAHDGSAVINVPEPTSLAILGLGLLGFAGVRRRKS